MKHPAIEQIRYQAAWLKNIYRGKRAKSTLNAQRVNAVLARKVSNTRFPPIENNKEIYYCGNAVIDKKTGTITAPYITKRQ